MDIMKTRKNKLNEFYLYAFSTLIITCFVGSLAGMTMLSAKFDFVVPVIFILFLLSIPIFYFSFMAYRALKQLLEGIDLDKKLDNKPDFTQPNIKKPI